MARRDDRETGAGKGCKKAYQAGREHQKADAALMQRGLDALSRDQLQVLGVHTGSAIKPYRAKTNPPSKTEEIAKKNGLHPAELKKQWRAALLAIAKNFYGDETTARARQSGFHFNAHIDRVKKALEDEINHFLRTHPSSVAQLCETLGLKTKESPTLIKAFAHFTLTEEFQEDARQNGDKSKLANAFNYMKTKAAENGDEAGPAPK